MRRVRINHDFSFRGTGYAKGQTVELPDALAASFIGANMARAVEPEPEAAAAGEQPPASEQGRPVDDAPAVEQPAGRRRGRKPATT